jgi:hypothetical protein
VSMPELYYFGYDVIFADGLGIGVSRTKDRWDRYIKLRARIKFDQTTMANWKKLSDLKKKQFIRNLDIEATKARIRRNHPDPTEGISVTRDIPINEALTDTVFYDSIDKLHSDVRLMMETMNKLFTELEASPTH